MILEHYSNYPLGELHASPQQSLPSNKPEGLWLSVKGPRDWPSVYRAIFPVGRVGREIATFHLVREANVLQLTTAAEIDTFHELYAVETNPAIPEHREPAWAVVASKFDGIIIAPFQPSRRVHAAVPWYFGWDCASACIWHPRAIERVDAI